MSDGNWIVPDAPAYVLCNPPEKASTTKGLLWGQGDPDFAGLQSYDYWAVAKVGSYRETEEKGRRCVEFKDHETVFEGTRVEAIKTLISLGADPARISVEVQVKDASEKFNDAAYARTGDCGTSIVAGFGIARTGHRGHATATCDGIDLIDMLGCVAWAGANGYAEAGDGGLAVVDGLGAGTAIAGNGGIAIGQDGFKRLFVGRGGKAVTDIGGKVWVGDHGIGICRLSGTVYGGNESIVIGEVVSGGVGSLLVARKRVYSGNSEPVWQVAYGFVGRDGIRAGVRYTVKENELVQKTDEEEERWRAAMAAWMRAKNAGSE
jgi:hypothetical protein